MKKHVTLVLFTALVATSCGKGSGVGGAVSPLSKEEKRKFEETMESLGRAQRAIPMDGAVELDPNDDGVSPASLTIEGPTDPAQEEMKRRLKANQARNECVIGSKFVTPDPEKPGIVNMVVRVSGPRCAVSMRMTSNSVVDDETVKGHMTIKYDVLDAEFRALNDIDAIDLTMDYSGNNFAKDLSGELRMRIDGKGTFRSQKYGTVGFSQSGDIHVTGKGEGRSGGGEMVARITFNDLTVEMKQVVKGAKNTYFINGAEVSETEYQHYFLKAGLKSAGM